MRRPHIFTLILLSGCGIFAMNIFLPVLPLLAEDLEVSDAKSQLVLTAFLATMAIAQLFISPMSDRFGRRPIILYSSILFLFGTILSFTASTFEVLILARILQGTSASFLVLSRAIIRDLYPKEKVASMIGYVTTAMVVLPMVAPAIGGYVGELWGWRAAFATVLPFAILALLLAYFDLAETNKFKNTNIKQQFVDMYNLLWHKIIWGYYAISFLTAGAFFAFLAGAPFIAFKITGVTSPTIVSLYFMLVGLGYLFGNLIAGFYSQKIGIEKMMLLGGIVATLATTSILILMLNFTPHIAFLFVPMFVVALGNGLALPNSFSGALNVEPKLAGSISGLGGFLQFSSGTIIAGATAPLLTIENAALPLYLIMFGSSLLATVIAWRMS